MAVFATRKHIFHPASIFVFRPSIFVFGTKGTISPGCILKQGYKVLAPSVWRRQATISPGYSPEPGLKVISFSPGWTLQPGINLYSRFKAPAETKGPLVPALGYNRDKIFLDKII